VRVNRIIAVFLLARSLFATASVGAEPLEKLIARADAAGDEKALLYAKVAQREVEVADEHFTSGDIKQAYAAVQAIVDYSDKSLAAAKQHHKKLKETEIALRLTSRHLQDVEHTLALEDRPLVKTAVDHIEDIRGQLLQIMFAPPAPPKR